MSGMADDRSGADAAEFKQALLAVIPHLRAFARGLCGRADLADDLVQETLLRAWAARDRFEPGTSIRAWTFVILRNGWRTDLRRNRYHADYDPDLAERILTAPPGQEAPLHLADLSRALQTLSPERREALLLVGAGGFSYEEAATICQCAVGTIKSRVARARVALTHMIDGSTPLAQGPGAPGKGASSRAARGMSRPAPSGDPASGDPAPDDVAPSHHQGLDCLLPRDF